MFFAIDNGKPGQTTSPDQVNGILMELPSEDFQIPQEWADNEWCTAFLGRNDNIRLLCDES